MNDEKGHKWFTGDEKAGGPARDFERICANCGACYEQAKDALCPNPQPDPVQIGEIDFIKQREHSHGE